MADAGRQAHRPAARTQIWVDAQLPPALAGWLRTTHGVDAVHIEELGLQRSLDSVIFKAARTADPEVVVITKDDDFPKLLARQGPPPRVVWVRCGNVTNRELRRIMQEAWPRTAQLVAAGEALVEIRRREEGAADPEVPTPECT